MNSEYIRLLTENEFPLWDEFVDKTQYGTLFHKTYWLGALGYKPRIYGYVKGGEILAGLPLTSHSEFGIKMIVHEPMTPYQGIIINRSEVKYITQISNEKRINREMIQFLKKKFCYISLRYPSGVLDMQPFIWEGFSTSIMYTYIVHLENTLENIWESMSNTLRNQIKKAEKDGSIVIPSDDYNSVIKLAELSFSRQKTQFFSQNAAYTYCDTLKNRKQTKSFLVLDKNKNIIAGICIVWDSKSAYYLFGGYSSEYNQRGASALALWEAIKFSKVNLNLKQFDLEGSMVPEIEKFFRLFGGELVPCYRVEWTKTWYKTLVSLRKRMTKFYVMKLLYNKLNLHME